MTHSDATTTALGEPGSDNHKEVLQIPQSSSITRASPLYCLVSYLDTHWEVLPFCRDAVSVFCGPSRLDHRTLDGESYSSAKMQSVYSTAPANSFRPTRLCRIVKFLQPSIYFTLISCAFTSCTKNAFAYFLSGIIAQFEFVKLKLKY